MIYHHHFQGRRKLFMVMVGGGGGLSKNVGHRGSPTTENLKKSTKEVSQKMNFGPKSKWFKISYLEFFFLKYYFGHAIFLYTSARSSGHDRNVSFNFRCSSRKSQNQQKLAKKITHFTMQFRSKKLIHLMNLNLSQPQWK